VEEMASVVVVVVERNDAMGVVREEPYVAAVSMFVAGASVRRQRRTSWVPYRPLDAVPWDCRHVLLPFHVADHHQHHRHQHRQLLTEEAWFGMYALV